MARAGPALRKAIDPATPMSPSLRETSTGPEAGCAARTATTREARRVARVSAGPDTRGEVDAAANMVESNCACRSASERDGVASLPSPSHRLALKLH
jgi:hypothetical protein